MVATKRVLVTRACLLPNALSKSTLVVEFRGNRPSSGGIMLVITVALALLSLLIPLLRCWVW